MLLRNAARWLLLAGLLVGPGCAPVPADLDFQLPAAGPRCSEGDGVLRCEHVTVTFRTGATNSAREMHFMLPDGAAPESGWPAVVLFTGSLNSAAGMWEARPNDPFGGYHQTRLVRALLEAGYAVLTPDSHFGGTTFWDTNVAGYSGNWEASEDHSLMLSLLDALDRHALGDINASRLFASGISSGGYMTSRMAVSYPGRFRALAIQSASYATCAGGLCAVPALPSDHPPTLFLHGVADRIVPIDTMHTYEQALRPQGTPTRMVEDQNAGHEWLASAPAEVVAWFNASR